MKRQLSFDDYLRLCNRIADEIAKNHSEVHIVAVSRGGLTPAHWIAKRLGAQVSVFNPVRPFDWKLGSSEITKPLVFVDDITDQGRTYKLIYEYTADCLLGSPDVEYASVVVDALCPVFIDYVGLKTSDWIVMPYEEFDRVVEGDKGLFRDGTNTYARKEK